MSVKKVALLTAGGLAPCLSSAIGSLIKEYEKVAKDIDIIAYLGGYKGLLLGNSVKISDQIKKNADILFQHGGSPIGNSRIKLTNIEDCEKRKLIEPGENPLKVAANQLVKDQIDVLHTIGGDDTNTTAADLASYLAENNYELNVVGLPKTIDNDVYPIRQSLGAWTAAEEGADYFHNVVSEHNANPRMLIVHEVMGRNCGWLTAYTAKIYKEKLDNMNFLPEIGLSMERKDVHAIYIPEMEIDISSEANRLKEIINDIDNVNIFISEGAGIEAIVNEMQSAGEDVPRDAFGHIKLDAVNPGAWFGKQFAKLIGAEKVLIQKSGYYARAAASNEKDLELIKSCAEVAVKSSLDGINGVVGHDEDRSNKLRAIEFDRIAGGKPFNIDESWFEDLLKKINQKKGAKLDVIH